MLQDCIDILDLTDRHLGKHIPIASRESESLKKRALGVFIDICKKAHVLLESDNRNAIEKIFRDYRDSVLYLPFITASDEGKKAFHLTNQLMHDAIAKDISDLKQFMESFDFAKFRSKVISTREFGGFLADHCTLLYERVKTSEHVEADQWLDAIFNLCYEHFSQCRSLNLIEYFAILDILPSSNQRDIEKAYRSLSKRYHPDKTGKNDSTMFRKVKEAHDYLIENIKVEGERGDVERPFDAKIKGIRTMLREGVKSLFERQQYDKLGTLLFRLDDLKMLDDLVVPSLNHTNIIDEIKELIQGYVKQARVDVDSNWSS
eukprot:9323460-Ditylum_brightwellii.AAC.1